MITRTLALSLGVLLLAACHTPGGGAGGSEVAAVVDGEPITLHDLDQWIMEEWFERESRGRNPSQLFQMRSNALDELLRDRALEAEAARRDVSIEELVAQELASIPEVSEEDVTAFYEKNKANLRGATLEEMSERIRQHLDSERGGRAIAAIVERAEVDVRLTPPRVQISAEGPSRGPENARVTIVEFSDFQCPYCQRAIPVLNEVAEKFGDDVRIVYRHLPLDRIHPRARPAAEAAACAHEQGMFWEFHDKLFENSRALEEEHLRQYARQVGLESKQFEVCVSERRYADKVDADAAAAVEIGITGTPAFVVNGVVLSGLQRTGTFEEIIQAELAKAQTQSPGKLAP